MLTKAIRRLIDFDQYKYQDHITFIYKQLEEMCVLPATPIWIYPWTDIHWQAVVGGRDYRDDSFEDNVYVFHVRPHEVEVEIKEPVRFRKNGTLEYR